MTQSAAGVLGASVKTLPGVGPRRQEALSRLGVETVLDLLYLLPREWQDRHELGNSALFATSGPVTIRGRVARSRIFQARPGFAFLKATLGTGDGKVEAVWFKHTSRSYDVFDRLRKDVSRGADLWVVGRMEEGIVGARTLRVEEHYSADDPKAGVHVGRLVPVYPLTEGIGQGFLRELIHEAVSLWAAQVPDVLPAQVLERRALLSASQAARAIHFPASLAELEAAKNRLAYEELLVVELAWLLKRRQARGAAKGFSYEVKRHLLTPFRNQLGFELTGAQRRVINEIFEDMQNPSPMTRLLQGDVGSGKTVVALSAMFLAAENGYQAAFMAPTELLADQHFSTLNSFLKELPVRVELLSSRVPKGRRQKVLERLKEGGIDILVGTHALLEEDVRFKTLKLAVIDEQHRFGVRQRATLRQKERVLDMLVMTATPIPRTLALALYGDLDVSTLDEMPPGKSTAETRVAQEAEALGVLRKEAERGRQGYVVYPIIEESSRLDLRSAKAEFKRLTGGPLRGLRVALIHGAMPGEEKARVMAGFARGEAQVLVATPVIEVGIDVPNATVMIIQNADRFGLSSLHQLRGRIGRGSLPSWCYLVARPKTEEGRRRVECLSRLKDGFKIAEEDLKLRGPGEFLGMIQHGDVGFKMADLSRDAGLVGLARSDAESLLAGDPKLLDPAHVPLRRRLLDHYAEKWGFIDLA